MFFFIKFKRKGSVNEKNGRSQNRAAASGSRAYESFYLDRTHYRNFNHGDFIIVVTAEVHVAGVLKMQH